METDTKMSDNTDVDDKNYIHTLPTELLNEIFLYLLVKELMICRQVCYRWKLIIDAIASKDEFWHKFCQQDFNNGHSVAKQNSSSELSWFNLYRSLSLWPKLASATEVCTEFESATKESEEIVNVKIRKHGILCVHKKCEIKYYQSDTLKPALDPFRGAFLSFAENNIVLVGLTYFQPFLCIYSLDPNSDRFIGFRDVKMFLLIDNSLYFVTLYDTIDLYTVTEDMLILEYMWAPNPQFIITLGYNMDCLHILTFRRNIYSILKNKAVIFRQSLNRERNILNVLYKYDFLERLEWQIYYKWMAELKHSVPEGPMSMISVIKPYGDVFFVGSQYGEILIFYKPYINGELDLFNTVPVRHFNIMDISVVRIADYAVLNIEAMETEEGHTLYVAMPQKVLIIKYTHDIMSPQLWVDSKYDHSYSC